jgi:uncharacterized membrane protein YbhN (UPF0104 family)
MILLTEVFVFTLMGIVAGVSIGLDMNKYRYFYIVLVVLYTLIAFLLPSSWVAPETIPQSLAVTAWLICVVFIFIQIGAFLKRLYKAVHDWWYSLTPQEKKTTNRDVVAIENLHGKMRRGLLAKCKLQAEAYDLLSRN